MSSDDEDHSIQFRSSRRWIQDFTGIAPCLVRLEKKYPFLRWLDRFLRGISEVVFMNNPFTGLAIVIAIAISGDMGWWYAILGVIGTISSTLAWFLLDTENHNGPDVDAGIYGFNGFLIGEAMGNFVSAGENLDGAVGVILLVVLLSVLATMVQRALGNLLLLQKNSLPALTLPFNIMTLMLLLGSYEYKRIYLTTALNAHIPLKAGLGVQELGTTGSIKLCFRELITDNCTTVSEGAMNAVFRGVGQIFFCDSLLAGIIILIGIALSSRISAVFALAGSAIGLATSVAFGVDGFNSFHGIWGYNAALSAMALGGFFITLNKRVAVLAVFSAMVTTALQGAVAAMFQPWGVPPFTLPFCIATLAFLAVAPSIRWMHGVASPTTPEEHLQMDCSNNRRRSRSRAEERGALLSAAADLEMQETELTTTTIHTAELAAPTTIAMSTLGTRQASVSSSVSPTMSQQPDPYAAVNPAPTRVATAFVPLPQHAAASPLLLPSAPSTPFRNNHPAAMPVGAPPAVASSAGPNASAAGAEGAVPHMHHLGAAAPTLVNPYSGIMLQHHSVDAAPASASLASSFPAPILPGT